MLFIHKLRSSSPRLLFCRLHDGCSNATAASSGHDEGGRHRAAQSPCAWLRLTAQEIRDKWQSLVARIGSRRRRQGQVAAVAAASEFGYDPTSYALNFEDDRSRELDGESPARNFSARLPESPDQSPPGKMPGEEVVVARKDGESPARNFSARLPESPDESPPGKMPGEEVVVARR